MKLLLVLLIAVAARADLGPRPMTSGPLIPPRHWVQDPASFTAESTHSYDVRLYRADFDLPMIDASYSVHEQVTIMSRVPLLDTFSLHFCNLVCDSVKRSGVPLAFTIPLHLLAITLDTSLPEGDSTVIDIFYHRENTAPAIGYYFGAPPACRYAHGMTCGCPMENRYWLACFDLPFDKPERGVRFNLTVPDTFQTCSNGLCDSVTANAQDGTRTWWWRHPYPIATYLMTFSASRFTSWADTFVNPTGETIPMPYYLWPEDSARSHNGFRNLPDMMAYFTDTLVYGPYPFEKYGMVPGYYGFPWGGMEHQTLTMIHTGLIGGGDVTLSHELSHMWWGDMVTQVDFRHVWLNEGFATYSECLYLGHQAGRTTFESMLRARAYSFFSRDRQRRFPVFDPPVIYDYGTVYCKGAWVQHMLRFLEGDTVFGQPGIFFRAMRVYGDSFRYGTPSTEDYCRIHEQVTGLELDWFFDEWIYQAGFPRYSFDWTVEETRDGWQVVTSLGQDNGAQAPDIFHMPLPVLFSGSGLDTLLCINPNANPQVDTFVFSARPESIAVDPDNWVLDSCYYTGIAENAAGPLPGPRIISIAPNPATGRILFQVCGTPGTHGQVRIYDQNGRRVRTLAYVPGPNGRSSVSWNRICVDGHRVPAGVYFARPGGVTDGPLSKLVLVE